MYSRMGLDNKARLIFVLIGIFTTLYTVYDYFQRKSIIYEPMPDWVHEGVKTTYDAQMIISPGILNETIMPHIYEITK